MKINSLDRKSWLLIEYIRDGDYSSYQIEAFIDIGHGSFYAKNEDIYLLNANRFAQELERFINDRTLQPVLNATYETYLKIHLTKENQLMLEFSIGDSYCDQKAINYSLNGAFLCDENSLIPLLKEFQSIV